MEEARQTTVTMSDAELAQFKAFQEAKAKEAAEVQKKQMRTDYREMVDDALYVMIPQLKDLSNILSNFKKKVFEEFSTILDLKSEIFKVEKGEDMENYSHTFTDSKGRLRLVLGHYVIDDYLDTVEEGIAKVNAYIQSLARDEASEALVKLLSKALSKDSKGTLKAQRVIQLRNIADQIGAPELIEGVKIIMDSYRPQKSRTYLKAYIKNKETGAWDQLPLGMTEA